MTLSQLERYMISEIENLHLKIDSIAELLVAQISEQIQELKNHMNRRFDQIDSRLDVHEQRLGRVEQKIMANG